MNSTIEKLGSHSSSKPSRWREEAEYRLENKIWLRYSQMIAMKMLDKMEHLGMTQKVLAERMGCSQQYVSKILRGRENLSLETLSKIEDALELQLVCEVN
jgi:ribosome-binding protein aMBF1 (putative translation factor)